VIFIFIRTFGLIQKYQKIKAG